MNTLRQSRWIRLGLITGLAAMPSCGADGFLRLEDYQRDLLTGGLLAAALLTRLNADQPAGTPQDGRDGEDGLTCWDLDGDGVDDAAEDTNGDGAYDVRDCASLPGDAGQPGSDGIDCWDLNANGVADPGEDVNGDGSLDALDCQGPAGADGEDGVTGPTGPAGPAGAPGIDLFQVFVDDFFAVFAPLGEFPVNIVNITEPALGAPNGDTAGAAAVAYRAAVPQMYDIGNDVNMRLFLDRTGVPLPGACMVLRLDARRLRPGGGVEPYDHPDCAECGTRYLRIDSDALPANAIAGEEDRVLLVLDLPVNRPGGLDFPNDLAAAQFLAFELSVHAFDGALYHLLAVEITELRPGGALLGGATVFESADEPMCDSAPLEITFDPQ